MAAYATRDDFTSLGLPAKALTGVASPDIDAALESASRVVESYIGKRFDLPLVTWDESVTQAVVSIAQYRLLMRRGFAPGTPDGELVRQAYEDAIGWCKDVAKGLALPSPITTTDQSAVNPQSAPFVSTLAYDCDGNPITQYPTPRGW